MISLCCMPLSHFKTIYLYLLFYSSFICFDCAGSSSLVAAGRAYSLVVVCGLLLLQSTGSRACRPPYLWYMGSVVAVARL